MSPVHLQSDLNMEPIEGKKFCTFGAVPSTIAVVALLFPRFNVDLKWEQIQFQEMSTYKPEEQSWNQLQQSIYNVVDSTSAW
jgi:hypothetical protein